MVMAAAGGQDRAEKRPIIPIIAAGAAGLQAVVAAKYLFYQMPRVEKAWCPYCIVDALSHLVTFGLTMPEAKKAMMKGISSPSGAASRCFPWNPSSSSGKPLTRPRTSSR
jgi:hypothetical protein